MIFHDIAQILSVEQNQGNDTTTDGCISEIEYRAEEDEMLPSTERHPLGPCSVNYREIEHVNHFTVEEACVASVGRKQLGYLGVC